MFGSFKLIYEKNQPSGAIFTSSSRYYIVPRSSYLDRK